MSEIKLKNCPFCGGEAEMGFRDASAFVMCTKCLARSRTVAACVDYTAREVAADEWNQRASEPLKASWTEQTSVKHIGKTNIPISKCSHCGFTLCDILNRTDLYNYCPSCGARMDLIETDDDLLQLIQKKRREKNE